jgi:threonine/homoserine efflux transporter RhtA
LVLDGLVIALVIAAVLALPLALTSVPAAASGTALSVLAIVAVLGTASPYMLEPTALRLRRLTASSAGILFSIEVAIAALVGATAVSVAPRKVTRSRGETGDVIL